MAREGIKGWADVDGNGIVKDSIYAEGVVYTVNINTRQQIFTDLKISLRLHFLSPPLNPLPCRYGAKNDMIWGGENVF